MLLQRITDKIKNSGHPDKFRFAIIADPQICPDFCTHDAAVISQESLKRAVQEINNMDPVPDFLIFLGDIINSPDQPSYDNFEKCIQGLVPDYFFVHGNHDSRYPYEPHRKIVKKLTGMEDMYFSFDAGSWHFAALPCVEGGTGPENDLKEEMLEWLEKDLEQNKDKKTIMLVHMHGLPQGTTQTEWYCYPLKIRLRIVDIISKHGNVRYYFNGHIHNVLKASVKNLRQYRGVTYVSVPSVTQGRPYNEEFPGLDKDVGGYYIVADVDGDAVSIRGYQAFKNIEIKYPMNSVPVFTNELEPRWFHTLQDIPANPSFINGGFEEGLKGWYKKYRYLTDSDPQYAEETTDAAAFRGSRSARLMNRAVYPEAWANDENCEIYQIVRVSPGCTPMLQAKYFFKNTPVNGGGFIRLTAMKDDEFKFMMMFRWGKNEEAADFLPRCFGYELHGTPQSWNFLYDIGNAGKGMFYNIDDTSGMWHDLSVNIKSLYDESHREPGAFDALEINKIMVGLGTWVNREVSENLAECTSEAFFDEVYLDEESHHTSFLNDDRQITADGTEFVTAFGKSLREREERRKH